MDVNGETKPAKAPAKGTPTDNIGSMIEKMKPQLMKALPKHVTAERLARVVLTAIRNNTQLQQADPMSLMGAIMVSAQLGLEPNTPLGQCYIIPYRDNKKNMINAQFQMGYKGLIDLAHRSGQYRKLTARIVDKADKFEYEYGLDERLIHVPAAKPSGEKVYYYAVYELENGGRSFTVWSHQQVLEHAQKYSQSFDKQKKEFRYGSAWRDSFDSMACKTVLIDLLRYAPKSVEVQKAVDADFRTYTVNPDDPDLNIDAVDADFELSGE